MTSTNNEISNPREIISTIMRRYGARCSPEEFHSAVNVTFHDFESQVYNAIHGDMWQSLPREFSLLAEDCLRRYPSAPPKMRVLDIGAGTGLASDCLQKTAFGSRITSIDLLDTSPSMLERAKERSAKWNVPTRSRIGLIHEVPQDDQYELIVTCSVLHHVPDVEPFCQQVRRLQAPGGIFLHLQDPNAAFIERKAADETGKIGSRISEQIARFTPRRIWGRIMREVTGKQGEDYISKTNRALMEAGIITSPLRVADLFAITDIHVHDTHGISVDEIGRWLPDYECLSRRSYAFFGKLWSELSAEQRSKEEDLSARNDLTGAHIGAAWRLKEGR